MADYDEEKYERLANELRALYVDAEQVMLRRVAKRIAKGVTQPGWTEKKASEISAARQEIEEAIQNLEERAREAWTPAIEESYRKGWVSGKTDIERFGDTVGTTHLSPNSLKAASILQELDQSISAADRRILRQFDDEYAGIIGKASALMATGSITTREAVQQALTEFADAGISGFTDRAGRRWELGNYAEMAVLTAIEKASVEGYTDTMQAYGYDLAIISSHAGSCPLCEAWEGVIVSVSGENTEYPSLDEAEGAGAFHPRCLHHLETYYEGISEKKWGGKLRSEPREIEEPSKQYTQRSLQRYNERQIRKYKRRMAVAVTPEAERRAYNKVRQWQAAQRQLIDDSDGQLLRQYQREGGRQNLRLQSKPIRIRQLVPETSRMSSEKPTSWPAGDGGLTEKQLQELSNYAEAKGVHFDVNSFKRFEGTKETIIEVLDALGEVAKDFPYISSYDGGVTLRNSYNMVDKDYAMTEGMNVVLNNNAFRNKTALREDYARRAAEKFFVSGTTYRSIGYHESGHIVVCAYRIPLKVIRGIEPEDISEYAKKSKKEQIAEAYNAVYSGIGNEAAQTIFDRCLIIASERDGKR